MSGGYWVNAYHRINQTLIAVSQIRTQPSWRFVYRPGRPLSVRQIQWWEFFVLLGGVFEHRHVEDIVRIVCEAKCITGSSSDGFESFSLLQNEESPDVVA